MSPARLEIRPYSEAMRPQLLALLGDDGTRAAIWDWQFNANPHGAACDPVVLCEGERVAGFNGVMPVRVRYGGAERDALWSCDFFVAEALRGRGCGKRIKQTLAQRSPLMMSFGMTPVAEHVLVASGWAASPEVRNYRWVRRPRSLREVLLWLAQGLGRLPGLFRRPAAGLNGSVSDALPPAAELDALWRSVAPGYAKAVCRDAAYLHWKYQQHPRGGYQFLSLRAGGRLVALGVMRRGSDAARLVDYLGPAGDYGVQRALVRGFARHFAGADTRACTTSDAVLGRALQHEGLLGLRTRARFCVHSALGDGTDCALGWFVMGGDSDGELLMAARGQ